MCSNTCIRRSSLTITSPRKSYRDAKDRIQTVTGLPMRKGRRLVLWRLWTSRILWQRSSNLCHSRAVTPTSTQINHYKGYHTHVQNRGEVQPVLLSPSPGQQQPKPPSVAKQQTCGEQWWGHRQRRVCTLVCTCPPIAKPQAAKTAKCHQAVKLWRAVMRTPTTKSLVRVIAYSVVR